MDLRGFNNRLRVMASIDRDEMVAAGIDEMLNDPAWRSFSGSPWRWLISASDDAAAKLWTVIERRCARPAPPAPTTVVKAGTPRLGGVS